MIIENRESMAFTDEIGAGQEKTLTKKILKDAKVKRIMLQIPDGPDGSLKVYPYFEDSKGTPKELVNFIGSNKYLSGNNIDINLFVDTYVEHFSTLAVYVKNDGAYAYPLQCFIEVEYMVDPFVKGKGGVLNV